jgi:two-component system sensor histidine kinase YesM
MTHEEIKKYQVQSNSLIGIVNTNKRIKMLFGDEYGIHIYSQIDEGTTITISLPIQ